MPEPKIILVTGATRGIGRVLAEELSRRGHKVYGAGRSWKGDEDIPFIPLTMDVTEEASVSSAVSRVIDEVGRLDVLLNNAGIGQSGSIEESQVDAARRVFETNYFGAVRLLKAALPEMRQQGSGTIAVVGSAAGRIGIPFQGHYAASKFAVEGLCESLSHELRSFGIRVLLFQPGDVGTDIWEKTEHVRPPDSPYEKALVRFHKVKAKEMGKAADKPENVARGIARVIESNTKRLRHPVARGSNFILFMRKILPDSLFLKAVARNYLVK